MVLIIDDENDIREMLLEICRGEGIQARAVGPSHALAALNDLSPEVVVLDVSMPVVNGHQILEYLRSDPWLQDTFVILLTAKTRLEDIEEGFEKGADDYLTKPFALEELLARVRLGMRSVEKARANGHASPSK